MTEIASNTGNLREVHLFLLHEESKQLVAQLK